MTWNAWEKIEKFHISETLRSPKHSSHSICRIQKSLVRAKVGIPYEQLLSAVWEGEEWPWQGSATRSLDAVIRHKVTGADNDHDKGRTRGH